MSEFFAMGGYAAFVWPSYLVMIAVLVWNVWAARAAHRRALADALRRAGRDTVAPAPAFSREGAPQ